MTAIDIVQIACGVAIPLSIVVVWLNRHLLKRGIGVRSVQFVAAASTIPGLIILAVNGMISGETAAALFGAFIGYLFANIPNFDDRSDG